MKDTDLKHLTLKTAFLLALASGKCRSEIHAWVANKVSNLGQWEKVALFPSSDFIAKNQLAREGSQTVSPINIPALTTIVDRQFKEDRTLCPVRALRYYLDRTKDLRGSRSLLFISFEKGHTSGILRWGIDGPDHASLSLEGSQHFYQFLSKRPYLVGQKQKYVSGSSCSGTAGPRPFSLVQSSSERKEGESTSATTKSSGV